MTKNINSKLTKLFLLSCANAAIMTAMVGEARADIEIYDILNHTPEYEALVPAQKLNIIRGIQAREDFSDLFDDLMPQERRLFNNEIIEVNKLQAAAPVLNGARERREARAAGVEVVDLTGNTAVETGRNEQEMALENRLQVLEILAKAEGANAVSVNDKIKKAIHFNNIENLNTPLEQLKYITMAGGVDANDNLKVVNNYVEAPLTKEAFEHIYFSTNITDPTVRNADIAPDYYKPGQSDLLKKFKSVATPETKRKLLNQFENYVTQNLVELEANKSNIPTRQAIIKLADPARLVTYLEKMAELKTSYIDNGKKKVVNEEGKLLDEAGLKNYNKILKDAGLITKDLTGKKMQALIDNFDALTMSDLALVLTKTVGEIKIDNERLVGLNNTMPPFRGAGGRPVRNLNNLDAIADLSPELKLAGHDLKAKEDAVVVVRGPAPVIGGAVEEVLVAPNTDEGTFHNEMYLVKNTKNPEKLEVRTLGAENDLGITIRTLLTLEERKAPHESLALFSEANPDKAQLIIKAKNIWNRLKNDDLIKQTSRQALTLNNKIANGTFFEELFNEEEHKAINRLNYTFGKLPLDLQNHITARSNEIKIKDELQGQKTIISRIDYIAKNENVLGANSLNNEIERIVDNFNSLKLSDILDIALNKENVRDNIALTPKANEVNIRVNNWINNNIVNLTVDDSLGNGKGKLDKADLTSLQNKAAPATLSKIYEIGVDTKAKLLKKVLADNAADLSKASKNITEKNITDAVQNDFNAKMKALTPGTKDFSKEQIVKFLNVISDAKIKAVLKEVKTAKAASTPAAAPVAPVAPLVLPADPEEVAVPAAPAINMEDVVVVPPPVEEAPQADAEIMIVRHIDRIVPVEGDIEDFDDEDDDEDFEEDDDDIIQEQTKLEVSGSTTVVVNKLESKDSEDSFENLKQEEARKEEEAKVAASIKEAEEARIAEAVRVEAAEGAEMQNTVKQDEEMIGAIYNPIHDIITQMSRNIISHRMFSSAAVAAGDEDEKVLDKGLWIAGTIGTNKQKGTSGYKGHASGGTIGFDVGSDNFKDLVGIAYTKLDSKFKSSGSRLNTTVDSHILALYGQKELPKNFMIQAMFAYNHNIVKSKINRLGTIATGKYTNNNYNFETLLSYNHLINGGITLTPNLGIRYGHSKDGTYQESNIGIQHLSIASKKQHLWSGILGGSVALVPQKIAEGFNITPALQGSVENYFNNKSKKLNAKVKWKDREVNETIALPKQPKVGYNIGASVLTEKGNVSVTLEYNCHLQKKYQSHQGFVKL